MGDSKKENKSLERLNHLIEQKTNENEALKKLLDELNKDNTTASKENSENKDINQLKIDKDEK